MSEHPLLRRLRALAADPPDDLAGALIGLEFESSQKIALQDGKIVVTLHGVEHRFAVAEPAPEGEGAADPSDDLTGAGASTDKPKRGPGRRKKENAA